VTAFAPAPEGGSVRIRAARPAAAGGQGSFDALQLAAMRHLSIDIIYLSNSFNRFD